MLGRIKESMQREKLLIGGRWIIFVFALICGFFFAYKGMPTVEMASDETIIYKRFTYDSIHAYVHQINEKSEITNWHSALFMYEHRQVNRVMRKMLGEDWHAGKTLCLTWWLCAGILIFNMSYLLYVLVKDSALYSIVLAPLLVSYYWVFNKLYLGLDFYFITLFILCISILLCLIYKKMYNCKLFLFLALFLVLWHMGEFRKTSILLFPCIFYFVLWNRNVLRRYKILFAIVASFIMAVICLFATSEFLKVQKTNPENPMLASDLYIAAWLQGDEKEVERHIPHKYTKSLVADYAIKDFGIMGWTSTDELKNAYTEFTKNHLDILLLVKGLQIVQFYNGGATPVWLQQVIENAYPYVKKNSVRWLKHPHSSIPSDYIVYRRWVILIGLFCMSIHLLYARHFNRIDVEGEILLVVVLLLLCYSVSFVPVTPTPDERFIFIAQVIGVPAICTYVLWLVKRYYLGFNKNKGRC